MLSLLGGPHEQIKLSPIRAADSCVCPIGTPGGVPFLSLYGLHSADNGLHEQSELGRHLMGPTWLVISLCSQNRLQRVEPLKDVEVVGRTLGRKLATCFTLLTTKFPPTFEMHEARPRALFDELLPRRVHHGPACAWIDMRKPNLKVEGGVGAGQGSTRVVHYERAEPWGHETPLPKVVDCVHTVTIGRNYSNSFWASQRSRENVPTPSPVSFRSPHIRRAATADEGVGAPQFFAGRGVESRGARTIAVAR